MITKTALLILSIMMPQNVPDIDHITKMKDMESCWVAAKEFTDHDLSDDMRAHGAVGLKATCGYFENPSTGVRGPGPRRN